MEAKSSYAEPECLIGCSAYAWHNICLNMAYIIFADQELTV